MKPEDILPDDQDEGHFGSEAVRKGTVGAFLANAKIINETPRGSSGYAQAAEDLLALLPKLRALGIFEYFELKPGKVRELVEKGKP